MKKIIIILLSISFSFVYSQEQNKQVETTINQEEQLKTPEFSDPDIQKFAEGYTQFINEFMTAVKEDNTEKISQLEKKIKEMGDKTDAIIPKFQENPEDAEKFAQYSQILIDKMQEILSGTER